MQQNFERFLHQPTMDEIRESLLEEERRCDWTVEPDGTMSHKGVYYVIPADRLGENWLEHMSAKNWVDMNTFVRSYIRACYIAGVKSVQITY